MDNMDKPIIADTSGHDVLLHDVTTRLKLEDDKAIFRRTQHIDDKYLKQIADDRHESHRPAGDMHRVASIPVAVVEKWMAEGFNIFDPNVGLEAIMKRLHQEDMERLIATNKRP